MTENEKNNWDELVDDLGVDSSAEAGQQPEAAEPAADAPPDFDVVQSKSSMEASQRCTAPA